LFVGWHAHGWGEFPADEEESFVFAADAAQRGTKRARHQPPPSYTPRALGRTTYVDLDGLADEAAGLRAIPGVAQSVYHHLGPLAVTFVNGQFVQEMVLCVLSDRRNLVAPGSRSVLLRLCTGGVRAWCVCTATTWRREQRRSLPVIWGKRRTMRLLHWPEETETTAGLARLCAAIVTFVMQQPTPPPSDTEPTMPGEVGVQANLWDHGGGLTDAMRRRLAYRCLCEQTGAGRCRHRPVGETVHPDAAPELEALCRRCVDQMVRRSASLWPPLLPAGLRCPPPTAPDGRVVGSPAAWRCRSTAAGPWPGALYGQVVAPVTAVVPCPEWILCVRKRATYVDLDAALRKHDVGVVWSLPGVELSVFHMLPGCGIALTVPNGLAVQEAMLAPRGHCARCNACLCAIIRDRRVSVAPDSQALLLNLWRTRLILSVLYERQDVRVYHWPVTVDASVRRLCTFVVQQLCRGDPRPGNNSIVPRPRLPSPAVALGPGDAAVQVYLTRVTYDNRRHTRQNRQNRCPPAPTSSEDDNACLCETTPQVALPQLEDLCRWCVACTLRRVARVWTLSLP
jgi:hypothetical protein